MIPARHPAAACVAALFVWASAWAWAQPASPISSPFLPPAGAAASGAQSSSGAYELTGTNTTSRGTQVCIFDAQAKRSHWIPVGGATGDIRVVSYDPAGDLAVISVHGSVLSLGMRRAFVARPAGLATAPAIVPIAPPSVPRNTGPPVQPQAPEIAKQEREARMLVSDLLEIGMQQRKAYEEAQKKAQQAQQAAAKPN